ncbi:MAG: FtsQ-type POTRA domain-containing protein [Actinomycetota bacterium]|nr:FtsQ-type POTRA domain-containing protein [Actinomycetota bacterium]
MNTTTRERPPGPRPADEPLPHPPVDPRIRARRAEVQRDAGRRRLRRLVDVGLVLAVVAGFAVALRSPLLDVDRVVVTGAARSGRDAVHEAAGINRGQQLMDVDLTAAGERVAALPWVLDVTVARRLDGTVRLEVEERTPVAVLAAGDQLSLVDATGRVVGPSPDGTPTDLVRLDGLDGVELAPGSQLPDEALPALQVAAQLAERVPGAVAALSVGPELTGQLAVGGEVLLGGPERLAAKLRSLATVLAQVDLTCLGTVDLRAPGNPVLTRAQGCS